MEPPKGPSKRLQWRVAMTKSEELVEESCLKTMNCWVDGWSVEEELKRRETKQQGRGTGRWRGLLCCAFL